MLMNRKTKCPMFGIHKLIPGSSLWIPITNKNIDNQVLILPPTILKYNINNSIKLLNLFMDVHFG